MELTYLLIKIKNLNRSIYINLIHLPNLSPHYRYVSQSVIRNNNQFNFFSQYVKDHIRKMLVKTCLSRNLLQKYNKFLTYKNFGAKIFVFSLVADRESRTRYCDAYETCMICISVSFVRYIRDSGETRTHNLQISLLLSLLYEPTP